MFDKVKGMMQQMQLMQKLMKDEHFKAFITHPKVQALFKDPEFLELMKKQDMAKLQGHPKLMALLSDPDVRPLMAKIDPKVLFQGMNLPA
jgi:hypothetical protein